MHQVLEQLFVLISIERCKISTTDTFNGNFDEPYAKNRERATAQPHPANVILAGPWQVSKTGWMLLCGAQPSEFIILLPH